MIQVNVIGRIGKNAEVKSIKGKVVINFSLAVNEKNVNTETGEVKETTQWFNCALWRNDAGKLPEYLVKGQQVFVQGTPTFKIYKKADKTPGLDIIVRVDKLELIGGKKDLNGSASPTETDTDWNYDATDTTMDKNGTSEDDNAFWENPEKAILEGIENPFEK